MHRFGWLTPLVTAVFAIACSAPASDPGDTVRKFFEHLDRSEYTEAMALYNTEALALFEDGVAKASFGEWAVAETKDGTLDEVKILSAAPEQEQESADVEYELVYGDGTTKQGRTTLTREEGVWKMGLVY